MSIEINLPEPPVDFRSCAYCGKTKGLKGNLIHWPSSDCKKSNINVNGILIEPFSIWVYKCMWCRAIETKKKAKMALDIRYGGHTHLKGNK